MERAREGRERKGKERKRDGNGGVCVVGFSGDRRPP